MNFTLQIAHLRVRRRILSQEIANARLRRAAAEREVEYWLAYEAAKIMDRYHNVQQAHEIGHRKAALKAAERRRLAERCA